MNHAGGGGNIIHAIFVGFLFRCRGGASHELSVTPRGRVRAAGHFHIRCASFDGAVGGVVRNQMSRRCTRGKPPSASFPLLPCPPSIRLRAPPVPRASWPSAIFAAGVAAVGTLPRASWPSAIPPTDAALVGTFPLPRFPSSPSRCRQLAHPSRLTCFSAVGNIHSRRCSRGNPHVAVHIPVLLGRRQVPRLTLHSWELSPSPASPPLPSRRRQLVHPSRSLCFLAIHDTCSQRCSHGNFPRCRAHPCASWPSAVPSANTALVGTFPLPCFPSPPFPPSPAGPSLPFIVFLGRLRCSRLALRPWESVPFWLHIEHHRSRRYRSFLPPLPPRFPPPQPSVGPFIPMSGLELFTLHPVGFAGPKKNRASGSTAAVKMTWRSQTRPDLPLHKYSQSWYLACPSRHPGKPSAPGSHPNNHGALNRSHNLQIQQKSLPAGSTFA